MERRLGPWFAALVALFGGALVVVTLGAYVLSSFCWEYCEPEDAPSAWDALKFALPFGLAAIGVMTVAAYLFMIAPPLRRGSWPRALVVSVGSCVAGGLLFAGFVAWYDELPSDGVMWLAGAALVIVWDALTGVAARALAVRS